MRLLQFFRKSRALAPSQTREGTGDVPAATESGVIGGPAVATGRQRSVRPLIDVQTTVLNYPGPALTVDSRLEAVSMNRSGELLCQLLSLGDGDAVSVKFRDALRETIVLDMPTDIQIELMEGSPERVRRYFDVCLLPCVSAATIGNDVLVLANETTVDKSLTNALVRSRELYRDLLKCSSDFAWETDAEGRFEFISERGACGYTAEDLDSSQSDELLARDLCPFEADWSPFSVAFPIEGVETWIKGADEQLYCMLISSVPILDENGLHTGTRGAGVDVTQLRRHEKAQAEKERRQKLVDTLLATVRTNIEPEETMRSAAREIAAALDADLGCVVAFSDKGAVLPGSAPHSVWNLNLEADDGAVSLFQGEVENVALTAMRGMGRVPTSRHLEVDGQAVLVSGTLFGDEINGGLVLVRQDSARRWNDDDLALLDRIAGEMGVVLARTVHARELERLARVDPMTQLLNRRAFFDDADLCLARNERAGRPAAYIYFDLDDFKRVNDTRGHAAGDALLIEFAKILTKETRRGDLSVRLGGDEFGLLLDNCDEVGAIAKAELILDALSNVAAHMQIPWELSVSAGIALNKSGSGQLIAEIMERADAVLYGAKKAGKNAWRLAVDPVETGKSLSDSGSNEE